MYKNSKPTHEERCVYCEEVKEVKEWKETGEQVCYDCRFDMLNSEFEI